MVELVLGDHICRRRVGVLIEYLDVCTLGLLAGRRGIDHRERDASQLVAPND